MCKKANRHQTRLWDPRWRGVVQLPLVAPLCLLLLLFVLLEERRRGWGGVREKVKVGGERCSFEPKGQVIVNAPKILSAPLNSGIRHFLEQKARVAFRNVVNLGK